MCPNEEGLEGIQSWDISVGTLELEVHFVSELKPSGLGLA